MRLCFPSNCHRWVDAMSEKDYSLDALNRFFDAATERGLLKRNTAQSRKHAANKILSVLEDSETADLRTVDIDSAFERFQNKQGMQYKPDSLQVYLSRIRTAISDFVSYVDNPAGFKPASVQRSRSKPKEGNTNAKDDIGTGAKGNTPPVEHHDPQYIAVPVPLREGLTIKISNLPADLTVAEANRVAAIIKAFAVIDDG